MPSNPSVLQRNVPPGTYARPGASISFRRQMQEMVPLTHELNHLLEETPQVSECEDIGTEIETLTYWVERYHSSPAEAYKIARNGDGWLRAVHAHLQTAAAKLEDDTLEPDVSCLTTISYGSYIDKCIAAKRRTGKIISTIGRLLGALESSPTMAGHPMAYPDDCQ